MPVSATYVTRWPPMVTVFVVSTGLWVASGMVAAGGLVSSFLASALAAAGGAFVLSLAESGLGASAPRSPKAHTISNAQLIFITWFFCLYSQRPYQMPWY